MAVGELRYGGMPQIILSKKKESIIHLFYAEYLGETYGPPQAEALSCVLHCADYRTLETIALDRRPGFGQVYPAIIFLVK